MPITAWWRGERAPAFRMKVLFLDPIHWDYDPTTPLARPLGGSQSAVCYLAVELAKRGHEVVLLNSTRQPRTVLGVQCRSIQQIDRAGLGEPWDALVVVNGPADQCLQVRPHIHPKTPLIYWAHIPAEFPAFEPLRRPEVRDGWNAIACVSEFHRGTLVERFGLHPGRVFVLRNGVAPSFQNQFHNAESLQKAKGSAPTLAYTSAPSRGLEVLADVFPRINKRYPQVRAQIFSAMSIYQLEAAADPFEPLYERCRTTPGMQYVGNLSQPVLAEKLKACSILAYPATTTETSSIAVLEGMAAGLAIVSTRLGALPETSALGQATLVEPLREAADSEAFKTRFCDAVCQTIESWLKDPVGESVKRFQTVTAIESEATWRAHATLWEAAIESWKRETQDAESTAGAKPGGQEPAIKQSPPAWYGAQPANPQPTSTGAKGANEPWLEVTSSRYFPDWLAQERVSLGFTTYQSGKLFLLGRNDRGTLSIHERTLNRVMGMWGSEQTLWMSTLYQLWRFENALRPGEQFQGHDRLYIPKVGYTTGDIDIHDIVVEASGRVVFVNTKFGCLATVNERYSFTPLWKPPFLSKLAPEDRCHLNGLALENGVARYVTAVSRSDVNDAWRDRRRDGGVVMSGPDGTILADGLSMPHSPRVYRGELWVLNSGQGYLGKIDRKTGKFEPVVFCPGYLRGLAFVGDFAVVGLSQPRHEKTFSGLPLDEELTRRDADSRCGLQVIDLRTGDIVHWLRLEGVVRELYDVVSLPGVVRPMALGFQTTEIQQILSMGDEEPLTKSN